MKKKFKKGKYYVVLKDEDRKEDTNWTNYIFEQSIDSDALDPVKKKNGNLNYRDQTFSGPYKKSNWYRLATSEEIKHYIEIDKPYDVTTLKPVIVKKDYTILLNKIKFINNYGIKNRT